MASKTVAAKTSSKRRPVRRRTPVSASAVTGSPEAMKLAVAILETLSGLSSPGATSEALGLSANRYYQLEARALQGLVSAMEPLPRGRTLTPERIQAKLEAENQKLRQELLRYQALVRTAQRTIGLAKKAPAGPGSAPKRRRRTKARAKTVLKTLRPKATPEAVSTVDEPVRSA
jgi:hypothetical protein